MSTPIDLVAAYIERGLRDATTAEATTIEVHDAADLVVGLEPISSHAIGVARLALEAIGLIEPQAAYTFADRTALADVIDRATEAAR